jgi:hypothetical protein
MLTIIDIFRENCKVSSDNSDITSGPFFVPDRSSDFKVEENELDEKYINFTQNFPHELKILYKNIGLDREITFKTGFTLMSLKNIYERKDNFEKFIDIGLIYLGMGHVIVLSMFKNENENKFFFRTDGGSNGYDREDNANMANNIDFSKKLLLNFKQILYIFVHNQKIHTIYQNDQPNIPELEYNIDEHLTKPALNSYPGN